MNTIKFSLKNAPIFGDLSIGYYFYDSFTDSVYVKSPLEDHQSIVGRFQVNAVNLKTGEYAHFKNDIPVQIITSVTIENTNTR